MLVTCGASQSTATDTADVMDKVDLNFTPKTFGHFFEDTDLGNLVEFFL